MNKNDTNLKEIKNEVITCLVVIAFILLLNFFYTGINYNIWLVIEQGKGLFLEIVIAFIIGAFLWGIFKKGKKAITALGITILLISLLNQIKFAFTGEPILFSDALYLGNTGELMEIVEGELWSTINLFLVPTIIEIVLFIFFIIIGRYYAKKIEVNSLKLRGSLIVIPILLIIILISPIQPLNKFILNFVFNENQRKDYAGYTTISQYYLNYGVIGGMYGQLLESRIQEPDDYDEKIVEKELAKAKDNTEKILGKPNIIVVFSESFWDIDQLEEVKFNQKVTPNFNNLKNEGLFFNMITPSYGGISANVEYEFLTGSNVMYFNHSYVPYMQLYTNDSYYQKLSIINELKNNGYRTWIATCASPALFNCGRFYKYLNVDKTEYITDVESRYKKGKYVSDKYITDKIIEVFNNKNKGEKLFYMTLTMQAHMPYPKDKYDNYDVYVTKSEYSQDINDTLTSYAQGIYDADKELGRLYEYIKQLEEPTIIVFYGDHLPYLYSGKTNAIDILEYFNTADSKLNNYRKYNTQSLILANFELEKDKENTKYLGPDLLAAYILNNMDINLSNYYKWLYQSRKYMGASNYLVSVDSEGNLYNTSELTGIYKEKYNLRKNIEYSLFVK